MRVALGRAAPLSARPGSIPLGTAQLRRKLHRTPPGRVSAPAGDDPSRDSSLVFLQLTMPATERGSRVLLLAPFGPFFKNPLRVAKRDTPVSPIFFVLKKGQKIQGDTPPARRCLEKFPPALKAALRLMGKEVRRGCCVAFQT